MKRRKKTSVAYVLWVFTGFLGGHQYYMGKAGRGVGYTMTGAWVGIGWLIDAFTLPSQVRDVNDHIRLEVYAR